MSAAAADELETRLCAALQAAIVADLEESLDDPVNKFTEASEGQPCKCYHNMCAALRSLETEAKHAPMFMRLIRDHMSDPGRTCGHVWHYKRIRKAGYEYRKPRDMASASAGASANTDADSWT